MVDKKTTEFERRAKKLSKKIRAYAIIFSVVLGISLDFYLFYKVSVFYDENKVIFQSPIILKIQSPFYIEKRQVKKVKTIPMANPTEKPQEGAKNGQIRALPVKSEKDIVLSQKHGEVLWKIYGLESTWGKADYCRLNGKGYGGFGVMDGDEIVCYPTFEKAVERAEYWLTSFGVDEDLAVALCYWNTGYRQDDCHYYQNYLSL